MVRMGTNRKDARARRARLTELMTRLAEGDGTAAVNLAIEFSTSIGSAVRAHLADLGVHDADREEVDDLVLDVCLMLGDIAGSWRADGGATPWQWAWHRVRGVVSGWVGQHADPLDEVLVDREAPPAPPGDEEDLMAVFDRLAAVLPAVALVRDGLATVASARDQAILLEVGVQAVLGDPSPAVTVAVDRGMSPDAVRQALSRTRRRLRHLAEDDERFAALADLAIAA
jgi:hypothetical protein